MLIAPNQLQGVVTNTLDITQFVIATFDELDLCAMTLAGGTRAIPTQKLVRNFAIVAICPVDLEDPRASWSLDTNGLDGEYMIANGRRRFRNHARMVAQKKSRGDDESCPLHAFDGGVGFERSFDALEGLLNVVDNGPNDGLRAWVKLHARSE